MVGSIEFGKIGSQGSRVGVEHKPGAMVIQHPKRAGTLRMIERQLISPGLGRQ